MKTAKIELNLDTITTLATATEEVIADLQEWVDHCRPEDNVAEQLDRLSSCRAALEELATATGRAILKKEK